MAEPVYQRELVTLYEGECVAVMGEMAEASVDAIVTDPPYGLEFMGKEWDKLWTTRDKATADLIGRQSSSPFVAAAVERYVGGETAERWHQQWAAAALRVLKPGGHILAFGGTRTHHRLMCALEDAGLEIRDCLMWLYGSGFPKSKNIGGGWGTALKPAWEPIILARKPLSERTVAANVLRHGTGALNIDGCRIGETKDVPSSVSNHPRGEGWGYNREIGNEGGHNPNIGRWPANLALDEEAAAMLDAQSGEQPSRFFKVAEADQWGDESTRAEKITSSSTGLNVDTASGARTTDRSRTTTPAAPAPTGVIAETVPATIVASGVNEIESTTTPICGPICGPNAGLRFHYTSKAGREDRDGSKHPTVKPVDLMKWLITLVTPPAGIVLDPFMGSGTTIYAARALGIKSIGIDREPAYVLDAVKRLRQEVLVLEAST